MVNYLNKNFPRLAELGDSLREFTEKNVPFVCSPEHTEAFDDIKVEITSAPILKHYDSSKPLTMQTDASLKGLDAVLLQEDFPISFAIQKSTVTLKSTFCI